MPNVLILDGEWTVEFLEEKKKDGSPYNPKNSLTTMGWKKVGEEKVVYKFFNHNERVDEDAGVEFQAILDWADLVVGHNLKADMQWVYACGFTYTGKFFDTMIFEYICLKGQKLPLNLKAVLERYKLPSKLDTMKQMLDAGINTNEMPADMLEEYGIADIIGTEALYLLQRFRYSQEEDVKYMWPAIKLSNEFLEVLIEMERNGVFIDQEELHRLDVEFSARKVVLEDQINTAIRSVMGDTPINIDSSDDMSQVVYSYRVKDKRAWADLLNIGTEMRGSVKKKKYVKKLKESEFRKAIREHMEKVERTDVKCCSACSGKGKIRKIRKDGSEFKKDNKCKSCEGLGVLYVPNGKRAGFKVAPISSTYASFSGFKTSKTTIGDLLQRGGLSLEAEAFLEAYREYNAICTYLTSCVGGIQKSIRPNGISHANFNQCVTSTGRLSSSGPNYQNFPRANTFPIRKVFRSRWEGGEMLKADFSALEYRVAVALSNCPAGKTSILEGKDRHELSAKVIFGAEKEEMDEDLWDEIRQQAKSETFSPLFGSTGTDEKRRAYKDAFFAEHTGITAWHEKLCEEAITNKQIRSPSGRIYAFPNARRTSASHVTNRTQIVNYEVQGFATGDVVPAVAVELHRLMKRHKVKSKLVLTVHDDINTDLHPEEKELMQKIYIEAFGSANRLMEERWNFFTDVPIGFEVSSGPNLLSQSKTYKSK